eukprot:1729280-Pleurochrysis_carterae.AAC.1
MPMHLADLQMTILFDVAALPLDGVFRFDESSVLLSDTSKYHMKLYICGELRKMYNAYAAVDKRTARELFSAQQL